MMIVILTYPQEEKKQRNQEEGDLFVKSEDIVGFGPLGRHLISILPANYFLNFVTGPSLTRCLLTQMVNRIG